MAIMPCPPTGWSATLRVGEQPPVRRLGRFGRPEVARHLLADRP